MSTPEAPAERVVGRYALFGEIASGGMATVHFGRLLGPVGFSRTVAIKRLHPQFAKDPEFVSMFLDEARLAGRIQHTNAVQTLDVVAEEGELLLVMEYVQGETLSRLLRAHRVAKTHVPLPILSSVMSGVLHGLHAAHEAKNEHGEPLHIVHRDISPQNVMIGTDGVARVLDFGVAKAIGRVQTTREGQIKGKLSYMAPEQMRSDTIDRRVDVYAAAVVMWESLAGRPLFRGDNDAIVFGRVMEGAKEPPSRFRPDVPASLDEAVMRGLSRDVEERFATAREMAIAIEDALAPSLPRQVGEWVERIAGDSLAKRATHVKEIESRSSNVVIDREKLRAAAKSLATEPHASKKAPPEEKDSSKNAVSADTPTAAAPPEADNRSNSQLSNISASLKAREAQPTRTRLVIAAGAVVVAALIAGTIALRSGGSETPPQGPAAPVSVIPAVESTVVTAPPPQPSIFPEASSSAPVTSASADAAPPKKVSRPPRGSTNKASEPAKPAAPKVNCSPPFVVGPDGVKRMKPECL